MVVVPKLCLKGLRGMEEAQNCHIGMYGGYLAFEWIMTTISRFFTKDMGFGELAMVGGGGDYAFMP